MPSLDHKPRPGEPPLRLINNQGLENMNRLRPNQFPYSSTHAPLSQLHSHWNGNPAALQQHSHYSKPTRRFQQPKVVQPSLISLDRTDLRVSLFQYPLLAGVTMLGTGKGTVKPPDIVLHGPQIAPQHAFLERLGHEVILHPISQLTAVDGRKITGPTHLTPGNLICIGESYFFRYEGPHQIYYEESPYAVINPQRSVGDVNKNYSMESPQSSSASSLTLESESQVCHPDQDQSFTSFPSPRSSSASNSDQDQASSISISTEDSSCRLDPEQFINRVARFELFSNGNGNGNGRYPEVPPKPCNSNGNGNGPFLFSPSSSSSPNGQVHNLNHLNGSSSGRGRVTFLEDGGVTSPSPISDQESYVSSSFVNSSIPSPSQDSINSSSMSCCGKGPHHSFHQQNGNGSPKEAEIKCETLLQIKRKQKEEARRLASEEVELDEILAMCEEYEEQIAKEIEEKRKASTSLSSLSPSSSLASKDESSGANYGRQEEKTMKSGSDWESSSSTAGAFNYGRIKTNGSLPRDHTKKNSSSGRSPEDSSGAVFSFDTTDSKMSTASLNGESHNGGFDASTNSTNGSINGSISSSKLSTTNVRISTYENISNSAESVSTPSPPVQVQSPPRLGTKGWPLGNGRGPTSTQNGYLQTKASDILIRHNPPTLPVPTVPTKSVSFSSSVKEYGEEDEEKEINLRASSAESLRTSGSNKNPVVRRIATEVQVHVEQGKNEVMDEANEKSPKTPQITVSKCGDDVSIPVNKSGQSSSSKDSTNVSQISSQNEEANSVSQSSTKVCNGELVRPLLSEDPVSLLRKEVRELEVQEMEAIREMEIEKALLVGEEKSLENQLALDNEELVELKDRLAQIDESNRRWKTDGLERIAELKAKLMCSEKELQRLERMHEEFCGSTDEETVLLERLKFQHELVESDRKAYEDAEFYHMEEEINRETHRDELSKLVAEKGRKLLGMQFHLEKVRSQNRISFSSFLKEIQTLEGKRQGVLLELRKARESARNSMSEGNTSSLPSKVGDLPGNFSDAEDSQNADLEEKVRNLSLMPTEDELHIERLKSRSPIDPHMGTGGMGPKTCETLREIERNREFMLNEQGVQMLEDERAKIRELLKRVQDGVRREWEASRTSRNSAQCHSLNSVGSEESGHTGSTGSEAPTDRDSGSGDDSTDKSGAPSVSTSTDDNAKDAFPLSQQMRQKQREMSQSYEDSRPLSSEPSEMGFDGSGSGTVTRREKSRVQIQNRPLTRYLPVRGDEEEFDLRAHIESSGHQLELCSHVAVNRTSARGFLSKLGSRFHNWNKRWFVFDREKRALLYYSDKSEKKSKARGTIPFEAIQEVYVDHLQSVKSPVPKLTFCVKTHNRVFHLLAPSAEAMRMWIDIIFTGAEGYKEFKCGA